MWRWTRETLMEKERGLIKEREGNGRDSNFTTLCSRGMAIATLLQANTYWPNLEQTRPTNETTMHYAKAGFQEAGANCKSR